MAEETYTLELLLNKATSPALYDDDWDAIAAFCDQVNKELEGPQFAVRLLAHKIQSPTEREALSALSTIESCVKHCGVSFHKEIGKFRFLNEIIKVLSPKFLESRTTDRVKKRCIELLYSWYKGLPHETKIGEAYRMLKDQRIILEDPTYMDKVFELFPPPKPRTADFEDEERSKELARLLKSKHPNDLKAANKLIKELVKEDVEKSEKRSKRIHELEAINTQGKLLSEMLKHYKPSADRAEFQTMKELYENLEKQRPTLFKLAGETGEQEKDAMSEILKVNDEVTKAMLLYMNTVEGREEQNGAGEGTVRDTSLLELGLDARGQQQTQSSSDLASGASAMLQSEFQNLGFGDSLPAASPFSDIGGLLASSQQQTGRMSLVQAAMGAPGAGGLLSAQYQPTENGATPTYQPSHPASAPPSAGHPQYYAAAHLINASLLEPSVFSATAVTSLAAAAAPSVAMADLDAIGQSLLEKNRTKDFVRPPTGPPPKLTMAQMVAGARTGSPQPQWQQAAPAVTAAASVLDPTPLIPTSLGGPAVPVSDRNGTHPSTFAQPFVSAALFSGEDSGSSELASFLGAPAPVPVPAAPSQELLPLMDVFVPLESIKPAENVSPLTLYDKNSLKCMIHFSENRPRSDILVMVLSSLSTNIKPITSFVFQAAVPKVMKIKLQPPSATFLPAFNPIHPPTAITQILLIANPRKEKVRIKFKISYVLGELPVSDLGDVEDFPVQ